MARPLPEFVRYCAELLQLVGAVRVKSMFGGHGLYVDELFIALVVWERLYLKADAQTRASFEAAGCQQFVYESQGKSMAINYWTAPEDAMESPALLLPWARLAAQAALRARPSRKAPHISRRKGEPAA